MNFGSLKICNEDAPKFQGVLQGQDRMERVVCSFPDVPRNAQKHLASHQKHLPTTFPEVRKEILVDQRQKWSSHPVHQKSNQEKYSANTPLATVSGTSENPSLDRYQSRWHSLSSSTNWPQYSKIDVNCKEMIENQMAYAASSTLINTVENENNCKVPKLFGVPLIPNSSCGVLPHVTTLNELLKQSMKSNHATHSQSYILDYDQFLEHTNSSKPSEFSGSGTLNVHPIHSRSCTKVRKHGSALGRSVDLSRFSGYDELINALDQMFDFQGRLVDCCSSWQVIYTNDEGGTMLIGDYPWKEFCSNVRKIFIYPHEKIDKLKLGC